MISVSNQSQHGTKPKLRCTKSRFARRTCWAHSLHKQYLHRYNQNHWQQHNKHTLKYKIMGTKARRPCRLSSLPVVSTLRKNASTSRTTCFEQQEVKRYPLSFNMTKITTLAILPNGEGTGWWQRWNNCWDCGLNESADLQKVLKTPNIVPQNNWRIFWQNVLSMAQFCFKEKKISLYTLHIM